MKKLFSMVIITLMIFTLAACTESKDFEVLFTFTDENQSETIETVVFNDDFEGDFQELMEDNFNLNVSVSDYGTTLLSIEHLSPKTGAYVAISKNGEMSNVGIDLIEFTDGDSFEFDVVWWDDTEKAVDEAIKLFLENLASDYVSSTVIDYNVISALKLLGVADQYLSSSEAVSLVSEDALVTVNDYFKAIIKLQSVGANTDDLYSDLSLIIAPGMYGQTAYGLLALDSNVHTADYSAFVISALADLNTTTPYDSGLDAGGISLVALSNYTDETGVEELITEFTDWITSSQLDSGGVKTKDITWGDTVYPGTENAASIAQVVMGLVANGINPTGENYTVEENNLITRLLEYQTSTGSFDWAFDDEFEEDLVFSTPQAFLALVVYQTYSNTYEAVNPYNFN